MEQAAPRPRGPQLPAGRAARQFAGAGVFFGRQSGLLGRRFGGEQVRSQPFQVRPDGGRGIFRRCRWLERPGNK
jgi:hypothetical protein